MVKKYPLSEIKRHNNEKSAWLLIHDEVFDVTEFLEMHPGGKDVILDFIGTDATVPYEEAKHSKDAREMLQDFKIGELADADRKPRKK